MNIRPTSFDEFIGQAKTKRVLEILCKSAAKKQSAVSHVLLSSPPGLGKTTVSRLIATEMGSRLVEVVGGNLQCPEDLILQLTSLKERDVLFIDEVHSMGLAIEELLYSAMEDFQVPVIQSDKNDFMKALGVATKEPRATIVKLPPFTLVAASTQSGQVSAPLRSRFVQALQLEPYTDDDLTKIIQNAALKMGLKLPKRAALKIAKRSRNTARNAICNLSWVIEYCTGLDLPADGTAINEAFELKGIDAHGLTQLDRNYLALLIDCNGPMGVNSLSAAINESSDTLENSIEPYLLQKGFIRRESRGRIALPKASEILKGGMVA